MNNLILIPKKFVWFWFDQQDKLIFLFFTKVFERIHQYISFVKFPPKQILKKQY